jgi:hypothetical protein
MFEGSEAFAPGVIELDGPDQGEPAYQVRPDVIEKYNDDQSEHAQADPRLRLHEVKSRQQLGCDRTGRL